MVHGNEGYGNSTLPLANRYEPKSKLASEVLLDRHFKPLNEGFVATETLVRDIDASEVEVEAVLKDFEADGLVTGQESTGIRGAPRGRLYTPTPIGWAASEQLRRDKRMRHIALLCQRQHDLADLILALVMSAHIENNRIKGGFWAADTKRAVAELAVYLCEYAPDQIAASCVELVGYNFLIKTTKHRTRGDIEGFDITARGQREYETKVVPRLHLANGESILDPSTRHKLSVFDAWQSECKPSRNMIEAVLPDVLEAINGLGGLQNPLEIVQATAPGEGAIRIDVALQEKIRNADLFIGDLTPVYAYGDRLRVNENVLVEVGFALASKEPSQIILLALRRDRVDVPGDGKNAKPTFDIAHVRRIEFGDKEELRRKLRVELEAVLRARGWLH
jgi:hypothetical protein